MEPWGLLLPRTDVVAITQVAAVLSGPGAGPSVTIAQGDDTFSHTEDLYGNRDKNG